MGFKQVALIILGWQAIKDMTCISILLSAKKNKEAFQSNTIVGLGNGIAENTQHEWMLQLTKVQTDNVVIFYIYTT